MAPLVRVAPCICGKGEKRVNLPKLYTAIVACRKVNNLGFPSVRVARFSGKLDVDQAVAMAISVAQSDASFPSERDDWHVSFITEGAYSDIRAIEE